MDIATLFGILSGATLIVLAIMMGGSSNSFYNLPSIMIVLGGTAASICINFPVEELLSSIKGAAKAFLGREAKPKEVVNTMVRIAEISRRNGLVSLEHISTQNHVLKKACQLIADNSSPVLIHDVLRIEIASMKRRHNIPIDVFTRLGTYAPAFGMLGTLIGLVQMLIGLDDPSAIGKGMAVAILTTFYGAVLAYVFFLPMAGKLRTRSMQEELTLQIIFEGARCILENNNPRLVYEKLSSFIPPKDRAGLRNS